MQTPESHKCDVHPAEFENIVRLRRIGQSRGSRRIHVEVEAMRAHIDRRGAEDSARPAVAAE